MRLIRDAIDQGMTFFDTAEAYGSLVNEDLFGEAVAVFRDQLLLATKAGFNMIPPASANWG